MSEAAEPLPLVRLTEFVAAPTEALAGSSALFDQAAPLAGGHPFLARFAPGSEPQSLTHDRASFSLDQDEAAAAVLLSLDHERADGESGSRERWSGAMLPPSEYMVAVVDKSTGEMKILEAAGEFLLTRTSASQPSAPADGDVKADERTYREKRGDLLGEFGGKRAKDRQARIDRNTITDANVSAKAAAQLEDVIGDHRAEKAAAGGPGDGTTSVVAPPHDRAAEKVQDAYPLLGLMGSTEFAFLTEEARAALAPLGEDPDVAGMENPGWSGVCWELMIRAVIEGKGGGDKEEDGGEERREERHRRVMAAMYLHYLFVLAANPSKRIGKREQAQLREKMAVSNDFLDCLLQRFADRKEGTAEYYTSDQSTTRLLYYAMVLWLTAARFSLSSGYDEVARALGLPGSGQLLVLSKHLGCKVKRGPKSEVASEGRSYRVSLAVPLTFPLLRKVRNIQPKR